MKGFAITTLAALGILVGTVPVARAGDTITPGEFHFSYVQRAWVEYLGRGGHQ